MVVSFGARDGAVLWKQQTGCTFPFLLDPSRQLYALLGMKRSVAKPLGIESMKYYADMKAAGRQLPKPFADDDPNQMGGDVVVDDAGKIVFLYRSRSAPDRPSVSSVLAHCN